VIWYRLSPHSRRESTRQREGDPVSFSSGGQLPKGGDIHRRSIIDARQLEAVELHEVLPQPCKVPQRVEIVRRHLGPERRDGGLNGRVELVVIHPDQPVTIGHHPIGPVHLGGKQSQHLLDAAFVHTALLHYPHQQAQINRQHRNIGARLGYQRLAD